MADDDSSSFSLDLDADDFIDKAQQATDAINAVGGGDMSGLTDALGEAATAVGVLGAAFFAVKEAFEGVFDAEKIQAVSDQFDLLSSRAGVMSSTLKTGLEQAGQGWATDTELMQAANRAMVGLETGAEKIPDLMNLAREATGVFGGTLTGNFDNIARAVETGNTRLLKQYGIVLDQNKVYSDYAKTLGISADALTEAGKQQAMMNAVLAEGKAKLDGLPSSMGPATTALQEFKTAMASIGESIALAWNKIAGPYVTSLMSGLKNMAQDAGTWIKAHLGDGAEKAAAQQEILQSKLMALKGQLVDIETSGGVKGMSWWDTLLGKKPQDAADQLKKKIADVEAQLKSTESAAKALERSPAIGGGGTGSPVNPQAAQIDIQKVTEELKKFQKDAEAISKQTTQVEIQDMDSIAQADKLYLQQRQENAKKFEEQIKQVTQQRHQAELLLKQADATHDQQLRTQALAQIKTFNQELVNLDKLKTNALEVDEDKLGQMRLQALQKYQSESENVFQGIGRAFQKMASQNEKALSDWGAYGDKVTASFATHAVSSIQAWGSGQKDAGQAALGFFGGMVGDMATQYGEMLLLTSVWPPNPLGLAAGAALIALGSALGSLGGGSPSGANVAPNSPADQSATQSIGSQLANPSGGLGAATQNGPKGVNLVIQGPMLMSSQTSNWLVAQVRAAADASDIRVQNSTGQAL